MARLTENIFEQRQSSFVEAVIVDCPTGDSPDADHDTACVEVPSMYSTVHGEKILKDVPIFYHCEANPDRHGRSLENAATAFRKGDHVILSTNPVAIVGFADGSLRRCRKLYLWISIQSYFYCPSFHPIVPGSDIRSSYSYEVFRAGSRQYVIWDVEENDFAEIKKPDGTDVTYPCTAEDLHDWKKNWESVGSPLFHTPLQDNITKEITESSDVNVTDDGFECYLIRTYSVNIKNYELENLSCPLMHPIIKYEYSIDVEKSNDSGSSSLKKEIETTYGENFVATYEHYGDRDSWPPPWMPWNPVWTERISDCDIVSIQCTEFDYNDYIATGFAEFDYNDYRIDNFDIYYKTLGTSSRFKNYAFDSNIFMIRRNVATERILVESGIEYYADASLLTTNEDIDPDKSFNLADLRYASLPSKFCDTLKDAMEISYKNMMEENVPPDGIEFGYNTDVVKSLYGQNFPYKNYIYPGYYKFYKYFDFNQFCDFGYA